MLKLVPIVVLATASISADASPAAGFLGAGALSRATASDVGEPVVQVRNLGGGMSNPGGGGGMSSPSGGGMSSPGGSGGMTGGATSGMTGSTVGTGAGVTEQAGSPSGDKGSPTQPARCATSWVKSLWPFQQARCAEPPHASVRMDARAK